MNVLSDCENKEGLIGYLYGEAGSEERRAVEAHLAECRDCREELESWQRTRGELAAWTPPEQTAAFRLRLVPPERSTASLYRTWGLAAAAVLVLAAASAVANLDIQYGPQGLSIRTGWSAGPAAVPSGTGATRAIGPELARVMPVGALSSASGAAPRSSAPETASSAAAAAWRAELAALEKRLRGEFAARSLAAPAAASGAEPGPGRAQGDVLRRVQQLIAESEGRQQRELALRMAQLLRDVEAQRRSDLVRIQQGLSQVEGITGAEAARQREVLNYLVRVSQQR